MSEILPLLKVKLKEKNVEWDRLAVFMLTAGDQILGDAGGAESLVGCSVTVTRPKRFIRLQKATADGLTVDFMLTGLDMIENGEIQVHALAAYWIKSLNEESQGRYLGILLDHLENEERERIARSGIILPNQEPRAFVMPNLRSGRQ